MPILGRVVTIIFLIVAPCTWRKAALQLRMCICAWEGVARLLLSVLLSENEDGGNVRDLFLGQ